jgi:hypothetical protein
MADHIFKTLLFLLEESLSLSQACNLCRVRFGFLSCPCLGLGVKHLVPLILLAVVVKVIILIGIISILGFYRLPLLFLAALTESSFLLLPLVIPTCASLSEPLNVSRHGHF